MLQTINNMCYEITDDKLTTIITQFFHLEKIYNLSTITQAEYRAFSCYNIFSVKNIQVL